jgi:hypothetical protein
MNATKRNQKMVNVTLSLSVADCEWLEAYADVTGKTFSEAASKGMSNWLNGKMDGQTLIGTLLKDQNQGVSKPKGAPRNAKGKKPSNLIIFPTPSKADKKLAHDMGIRLD